MLAGKIMDEVENIIRKLVNDWQENRTTDFKAKDYSYEVEKSKLELAKDTAAMANSCALDDYDLAFIIVGINDRRSGKTKLHYPKIDRKNDLELINKNHRLDQFLSKLLRPRINCRYIEVPLIISKTVNADYVGSYVIEKPLQYPIHLVGAGHRRMGIYLRYGQDEPRSEIATPDETRELYLKAFKSSGFGPIGELSSVLESAPLTSNSIKLLIDESGQTREQGLRSLADDIKENRNMRNIIVGIAQFDDDPFVVKAAYEILAESHDFQLEHAFINGVKKWENEIWLSQHIVNCLAILLSPDAEYQSQVLDGIVLDDYYDKEIRRIALDLVRSTPEVN